jgi:hypothetical protein
MHLYLLCIREHMKKASMSIALISIVATGVLVIAAGNLTQAVQALSATSGHSRAIIDTFPGFGHVTFASHDNNNAFARTSTSPFNVFASSDQRQASAP